MTSMNGQDKAGEPSMEEILASIRKIIAEEPEPGAGPLDADDSHPFAKASFSGGSRAQVPFPLGGNRPPPSMDRLSSAIKAKAGAPAFAPAPKRPMPLDDDVADLIEEPAPARGCLIGGVADDQRRVRGGAERGRAEGTRAQ